MRQIVVVKPGGHRRLQVVETPDPRPQAGQFAVAVQAIGVNFADVAVRLGIYDAVKDYPTCPGFEFAGRVVARGTDADDHAIGDEVFGITRFGAYADRVVVGRDAVWRRDPRFTASQAAALPVNFATAHYAIHGLAGARAGERVLIHSAAGGVGLAAVQLARMADLRTVGVVGRTAKVAVATRFGCEVCVSTEGDVRGAWRKLARSGPYDIILDAGGPATLGKGFELLAPRGRLITYGFATMFRRGSDRLSLPRLAWNWARMKRFNPLDLVMRNHTVAGFNLVHLFADRRLLEELSGALIECSKRADFMAPPVTEVPFTSPAEAHRLLESGDSTGKVVLVIA